MMETFAQANCDKALKKYGSSMSVKWFDLMLLLVKLEKCVQELAQEMYILHVNSLCSSHYSYWRDMPPYLPLVL